jgi:hypothetical protein
MPIQDSKIRKFPYLKISAIIVGIIAVLAILVIVFISPITKYLIEKYDAQYTGRKITMNFAYVNPFTGYIYFNGLRVFESQSDSLFLAMDGVSANVSVLKLFSKVYEVNEVALEAPCVSIIQDKKKFNFNDLIKRFSSDSIVPDSIKVRFNFNIPRVTIHDGVLRYSDSDKKMPIHYSLKKVNIESSEKTTAIDTVVAHFAFVPSVGRGNIQGILGFNVENNDYKLDISVKKFDLSIIAQYLKGLTNYGHFSANLDAEMKSIGNLKDRKKVSNKGQIAINDFHFGKSIKEDYASFDRLSIGINEISPSKFVYSYDSVTLTRPYFKYERYDKLDNIQTIFGEKGANIAAAKANTAQFNLVIEILDYIKMLGKNLFKSNYKVARIAIYKGNVIYNDFSLSEQFSITLNPMFVSADSINKMHKRVSVHLKSGIKPFGDALISLSINPKDNEDFDMEYNVQKLPAALLNPYLISFTSFPLDRGTIEVHGKWHVANAMIQSDNHLIVIDPRVGNRQKNKDTRWIPVRFIMAFIRERGNVIDYDIPITGSLKNPKFHFRDAIVDLVRNIFVKPVTLPYGAEVRDVENEIEKSLTLKWSMHSSKILKRQANFLEKIATFLKENPKATITVHSQLYATKEREHILFFEAKKKYFSAINELKSSILCESDSLKIEKMSVKDTLFAVYLHKHIKTKMLFTIQDKCKKYVGNSLLNTKFKDLNKERLALFKSFFVNQSVEKQVVLRGDKNVVPYNGFSFYELIYDGEFPDDLLNAYHKIEKLNDESPRKQFKKLRRKNIFGF